MCLSIFQNGSLKLLVQGVEKQQAGLAMSMPFLRRLSVNPTIAWIESWAIEACRCLWCPLRTSSGKMVGIMPLINRKHNAAVRITVENASAQVRTCNAAEQALIEALADLAVVCVQRTRLRGGEGDRSG